jgi:hypothetical protein
MIGRIHTNSHGLSFHVGGRKRPASRHTKMLAKYAASLPTAPATFDYTSPAAAALAMILANGPDPTAPASVAAQGLGDCTSCARSHIIDAVTAGAGSPVTMTVAQTIAFYSASTGYVLGQPATDRGGDEVTVLNEWQSQGQALDGHPIAGYLSVDPSNAAMVKSACWLFENLYFGVELADPWLEISGSGFLWDVGSPPDPNDGHTIPGLGGDAQGITVDSWGFLGKITYAAIAQFCAESAGGNLFVVLTPEIVSRAQGKSPAGLDWATLIADFDGLGGKVAPPPPSTPPAPLSNPPSSPLGPAT